MKNINFVLWERCKSFKEQKAFRNYRRIEQQRDKVTNITAAIVFLRFLISQMKNWKEKWFSISFSVLNTPASPPRCQRFFLFNVKTINAGEVFKYQTRTHILNSFYPAVITWSAFVCADYCQNRFLRYSFLKHFSIFLALLPQLSRHKERWLLRNLSHKKKFEVEISRLWGTLHRLAG